MATLKGIPLSKVSPAFLHANSTSHTWVFSAFAELIDNAYDPDVSASELLIDHINIHGLACLIFLDNGAGMDRDHLLKMLSFGFCEKEIYEKQGSHQPIGHYGNGFKSGSMRIGQDALVFTRCQNSACIGFLSQTYLAAMQADSVVIPILEYRLPSLERIKSQESRNNLNALLEFSVFRTEHELKEELKALEGSKTGTKVIISNLKRFQDGNYELDFASDPTDIRCPEAHEVDMTSVYHRPIQQYTSEYKCSLREYCSILFLRPRMKITIRGVRVKSKLISKSLSNTEIDMYKPTWLSRPVKIIFGFTCEKGREDDSDYGMMLYHRNRLIKAFEKVGYQKQPNGLGVRVVGVAQVDFLQPIHNKQDFNKDEKFHSVMAAFANKLNDYWNEKKGSNVSLTTQPVRNHPDWLWAQCDHCLKWRRLPDSINSHSLPDLWYCRMNPDATHNRCDIPEEPEDEDLAVRPTYEKTFKKKQEERKRLQQVEKEKEEEAKRRKIMEKERELKEKEAALRAIQQVAAAQPENKAVMSLQRALAEARRKEEQQKRLILQMQEQKKTMEEQRNSLLQLAESLQSTPGKKRKVVLDEMSKLIGSFSSDSPTPAPTMLGKRKSIEETPPAANRKAGKKMCIKTETGEMLSITQNDVDSDDNEDAGSSPPALLSKRLTNGQKENALPGEVGVEDEQALPVSASKPSLISPPVSDSVKNASSKRRTIGQSLLQVIGTATENSSHTLSPLSSKSHSQQTQKGLLMAVIDLTSDSEFGELVDIKPDLDALRNSILENIQQEEDIKPNKDAIDETLRQKDDSNMPTSSVPPLAETKQEMVEIPLQDALAVSTTALEGEPIHFQPINGNLEFSMDMPEDAEDNLDTADTVVEARIGQDMQKSEHRNLVSQNGVTKISNSPQDYDEDEEVKKLDAENLTVMDNAGDGSDFDGGVDDDDSDYRAYSTVDEKGDSSESHIDRRHCAVTEKSRSNSTEDGGSSSNQGVSDDGDYIGKQNHTGSSHLKVSTQIEEINESLAEGHASLDCNERSRGEYETREENDLPDMARDKDNDQTNSPSNMLEENSFSKFSPNQENLVFPKTISAFKNNSAVVHEDNEAGEDNSNQGNNELIEDRTQTVCTKQVLKSDISHLSIKPDITCENSVNETNLQKCENQIAGPSFNEIDMTFSGTDGHVEQLPHISSSFQSQSFHVCSLLSPLQNLSSPDVVAECNAHRTHDETMQTDLDMLALGKIVELYTSADGVSKCHHQACHVKDKLLSEIETTDKSLQALGLECSVSIAESQTEDTEWVRDSNDQAEEVEELHTKLSLRSQQLEDTERRLTEVKVYIHKLLGYIVPGTELGDANNIDQIVKDMIRIHEESLKETQSQEATKEIQTEAAIQDTQSQYDTSLS